jgi:hypothetical protein
MVISLKKNKHIMPTVILNHKVTDYNKWKAGFDADIARRESMGATTLAVGQKMGDPGNVYVVIEANDISNMSQQMADPAFQALLKEMGVLSTEVVVVE